jgi:hypothetical protein
MNKHSELLGIVLDWPGKVDISEHNRFKEE